MATGFLKKLLPSRADDDCRVAAMLHIDDEIKLSGMIMKIGTGVVLFRESSAYVVERTGEKVRLTFEGGEIDGEVTRSSSDGYLIRATAERIAA